MLDDILQDAQGRMQKSVASLQAEMTKIRTGRAHSSLLEHIKVNYYGTDTPLNQLANVYVIDARTLGINVYDKGAVSAIEKAIMHADLGLNPLSTGDIIRVPLPPLTEERRKQLIKVVRGEAEKAKIAIRNIRRDANAACRELTKEKLMSEDDERKAGDQIQKLTDEFINVVDKNLRQKESEMMEI